MVHQDIIIVDMKNQLSIEELKLGEERLNPVQYLPGPSPLLYSLMQHHSLKAEIPYFEQ